MFLNKHKFIESLFTLFKEADKELVLIVPYVKMSEKVYEAINECDNRKVETLLVCRTDCLHEKELDKLRKLKHLTLLTHPNLHSKIYLNQNQIIVGSMNLYEYSETFNREAGFIFNKKESRDCNDAENCINEIKQIVSGSEITLESQKVNEEGVDFTILHNKGEVLDKQAQKLSRFFTTKSFTVLETKEGVYPTCEDFYDRIDVTISNRVSIYPQYPEEISKRVLKKFKTLKETHFQGFRTYLDIHNRRLTIYAQKGEYISDKIFEDKKYVKSLEFVLMSLCKEMDKIFKKEMLRV